MRKAGREGESNPHACDPLAPGSPGQRSIILHYRQASSRLQPLLSRPHHSRRQVVANLTRGFRPRNQVVGRLSERVPLSSPEREKGESSCDDSSQRGPKARQAPNATIPGWRRSATRRPVDGVGSLARADSGEHAGTAPPVRFVRAPSRLVPVRLDFAVLRSRSAATLDAHPRTPRAAASLGPRLARNVARHSAELPRGRPYSLAAHELTGPRWPGRRSTQPRR